MYSSNTTPNYGSLKEGIRNYSCHGYRHAKQQKGSNIAVTDSERERTITVNTDIKHREVRSIHDNNTINDTVNNSQKQGRQGRSTNCKKENEPKKCHPLGTWIAAITSPTCAVIVACVLTTNSSTRQATQQTTANQSITGRQVHINHQ